MPPVRKTFRGRKQITLESLSIAELLALDGGPCRGWPGPTLTGLDVAKEIWTNFGDEITAAFVARSPGCRPWCCWVFELLPTDPRQLVAQDDAGLPAASAEAPSGIWPWSSSDGYESSFAYLRRRGLLGVDELASIRAKHDGDAILAAHRDQLERIAMPWRDNARMRGHELADLISAFPEIELTADELRRAEPFIL